MAAFQNGSVGVWMLPWTSNANRVSNSRLSVARRHCCIHLWAPVLWVSHLQGLVMTGKQCPILCLGGGTPHKRAVLGANGHVIHEATACARYLREKVLKLYQLHTVGAASALSPAPVTSRKLACIAGGCAPPTS